MPNAIAVIGGVVTSTLLTVWVVPVVFLWVEGLRARLRRAKRPAEGVGHASEANPLTGRRRLTGSG